MPTPFKLSRRKLKAAGACSLDYFFDTSPGVDGNTIEYPNGWQDADTTRVATDKPIALLWLAQRGLIPISYRKAKDKVKEIHGDKGFLDLVREYHAAANPPAPPPP
jgi:hypothetical protein